MGSFQSPWGEDSRGYYISDYAPITCDRGTHSCIRPRALVTAVVRPVFLTWYRSRRTGTRPRAAEEKLWRTPFARAPQQATASMTHATLLSLEMTSFRRRRMGE